MHQGHLSFSELLSRVQSGEIMKKLIVPLGVGLLLSAIIFLGVKSWYIVRWSPPTETQQYSVVGGDGRTLTLLLPPRGFAYFVYTEPDPNFLEAALVRLHGVYATNYFWNIWNVDRGSPQSPLGIRIFSNGVSPVLATASVLEKFISGDSSTTFPNKGEDMSPLFLVSEEKVEFQGMPLQRVAVDPILLENLAAHLPLPN